MRGETFDQLLGKTCGDKSDGVDLIDRRIELAGNRQVYRWLAKRECMIVQSPCQPMGADPPATESPRHNPLVQLGELPEPPDAEPHEELGQLWYAQGSHGEIGEPSRRAPRKDYLPGRAVGCEPGGERRVGYPDPAWRRPQIRKETVQHACQLVDQRALTAEIAGRPSRWERAHPGTGHLYTGCELRHGRHDRLEGPDLLHRILFHELEVRAGGLRLASALTPADTFGPRRGRARYDPVGT